MSERKKSMRRHLRFVVIVSCLLILFASITLFAVDYKYVSSKYSMEYHRPTCKKALKISPQIKVTYKTAKEALDDGKRPCKICNPPTEDKAEEQKSKEY
jgi:hypothetical protein